MMPWSCMEHNCKKTKSILIAEIIFEFQADTSDDDDIDVESFEDNGGKRIVNMIKDRTRLKK